MINDGIKLENDAIRSFLMMGQSNMAGRGDIADVPPIRNPLCHMLRMGRWQKMSEPINPDRAIFEWRYRSGVGLAASFADEVANRTGNAVGLIPCADGGTMISQWMPGELLYDHAVMQTKLAMRTSHLSGILWHQGESDCRSDFSAEKYKEDFIKMITSLKNDVGMPDIPVIIGELSHSYGEQHKMGELTEILNGVFYEIAKEIPNCAVVSSEGLNMKADGLHFDSASLRIFGRRYADKYLNIK